MGFLGKISSHLQNHRAVPSQACQHVIDRKCLERTVPVSQWSHFRGGTTLSHIPPALWPLLLWSPGIHDIFLAVVALWVLCAVQCFTESYHAQASWDILSISHLLFAPCNHLRQEFKGLLLFVSSESTRRLSRQRCIFWSSYLFVLCSASLSCTNALFTIYI